MKTLKHISLAIAVAALSSSTLADQVVNDDQIVTGSECIGFDCVNGENFGFDTLRLKENNLRIKFQDTSISGSFPSNDWQITANDSSNGGANKFSIDDVDSGRTPFTIEAGARSNSLYVDDAGKLGLGTSTPAVQIHSKYGDTPTVRLEQDGSHGWSAQTWDMAANEANFFIRDVTHGSRLPFRIKPGAPNNSIYIAADGDVGLGTDSPDSSLHVYGSDGSTQLKIKEASSTQSARDLLVLENKGNPQILLNNTGNGNSWAISAGQNLVIKNTNGDTVFKVTPEGDVIFKKSDDTTDVSLQALVDYIETTHNTVISSTTP